MAIAAGTTMAIRFLRRFSGNMEPPVYEFPVSDTSTTFRKGDAVVMATPLTGDGKAEKLASGSGVPISTLEGAGLLGFAYGASAGAPPFPSSAGVASGNVVFISPATVASADPIPLNEYVKLVLPLPDCIFYGHQTSNDADITAPVRDPAAGTGGVLFRAGLFSRTPTGETQRTVLDTNVFGAGDAIAFMLRYAYPQMPQARSTTAGADPFRVRLGASGTSNPAVEFVIVNSIWNPSV